MICMICNKQFIIKRRIKELLKAQRYYVCYSCYKDVDVKYNKLPIDNGYFINIITLLENKKFLKRNAYIKELSFVVEKYLDYEPIIMDRIYINDDFLTKMQYVSTILGKDVLVIGNIIDF